MQKKRRLILIMFFFAGATNCIPLTAQTSIKCINSKNNYLYVGIDNKIEISVMDKNIYERVLVTTSNGTIYKDSIYYNCIPKRSGRARITVHGIKTNTDTVNIFNESLMVYTLPPVLVTLGGKMANELLQVNKEFLLQNDTFEVHITDDIISYKDWIEIDKVTMGYMRKGGYYQRDVFEGNKLPDECKEKIKAFPSGKELSFEVRVKFTGNVKKNLPIFSTRVY